MSDTITGKMQEFRADSARLTDGQIVAWQRRQARIEKRDKLRGRVERVIPPLFRKARLCTLNQRLRSLVLAKPYRQGLVLWGGVGVGKSHTGTAVIRPYIAAGANVKRLTFKDLLTALQGTFDGSGTQQRVYQPLLDAHVLLLEDVATGKQSEFAAEALWYVIDTRLEQCRPTIITTNLSPEALEQAFGQRISSRLQTFLIVKLGGTDKRKQGTL